MKLFTILCQIHKINENSVIVKDLTLNVNRLIIGKPYQCEPDQIYFIECYIKQNQTVINKCIPYENIL